MKVFNRQVAPRGLTTFGFEILLISGSLTLAVHLNGDGGADAVWKIAFITALCQLCFYYNDLYDLTTVHSRRELLVRLLQASGAASIGLAVLFIPVSSLAVGGSTFVSSIILFVVAILAWRLFFLSLGRLSHLQERLLILGTGPTARK